MNAKKTNKENYSKELEDFDFSNNEKKWINEPYEDTFIRIIGEEEKGYKAIIGNYAITEIATSLEELKKRISNLSTGDMCRIIGTVMELNENSRAIEYERLEERLFERLQKESKSC